MALLESMQPEAFVALPRGGGTEYFYGAKGGERFLQVAAVWNEAYAQLMRDVAAGQFKTSEEFQRVFDGRMKDVLRVSHVSGFGISFTPKKAAVQKSAN